MAKILIRSDKLLCLLRNRLGYKTLGTGQDPFAESLPFYKIPRFTPRWICHLCQGIAPFKPVNPGLQTLLGISDYYANIDICWNMLGIDTHKKRAQEYDGVANMLGVDRGIQAVIQQLVAQAVYCHYACKGHSLILQIIGPLDSNSPPPPTPHPRATLARYQTGLQTKK